MKMTMKTHHLQVPGTTTCQPGAGEANAFGLQRDGISAICQVAHVPQNQGVAQWCFSCCNLVVGSSNSPFASLGKGLFAAANRLPISVKVTMWGH